MAPLIAYAFKVLQGEGLLGEGLLGEAGCIFSVCACCGRNVTEESSALVEDMRVCLVCVEAEVEG